jgi:hypothetical protein
MTMRNIRVDPFMALSAPCRRGRPARARLYRGTCAPCSMATLGGILPPRFSEFPRARVRRSPVQQSPFTPCYTVILSVVQVWEGRMRSGLEGLPSPPIGRVNRESLMRPRLGGASFHETAPPRAADFLCLLSTDLFSPRPVRPITRTHGNTPVNLRHPTGLTCTISSIRSEGQEHKR